MLLVTVFCVKTKVLLLGDIAFRIAQHQRSIYGSVGELTVCDINAAMLDVGKQRAQKLDHTHISWLQGDAENLSAIENGSYDAYTIAFGIRNVVHIDKVRVCVCVCVSVSTVFSYFILEK